MTKIKNYDIVQGQKNVDCSKFKGKRVSFSENTETGNYYTVDSSKKEVSIYDRTKLPNGDLKKVDQLNFKLKKGEKVNYDKTAENGNPASIMIIGRNGKPKTIIYINGIDRINIIEYHKK